ncbi:MAG TPA: amidase [Rhizobiales bacterium]|nr:amidase [Hyphomicrobiales bacterium]
MTSTDKSLLGNTPVAGRIAPQSLLKIVQKIDQGSLTTKKALDLCIERISKFDHDIHAFTQVTPDKILQTLAGKGPLKGVGLAIKDVFDTADLATEYNSPIYANHQPAADAALVALARKAGCTPVGKTVTTEFAFFHPGETRNPYNLDHTPGGSSSGSAAAVATGMVPLALGTQTGGSVIRPAAFCGVAGFKPSSGLLPTVGMKTFSWSLDTAGFFAKGVEDIAFATSVLTGRHMKLEDKTPNMPVIGIARTHCWSEATEEYQQQFDSLLSSLSKFGFKLVDLPITDEYIAAFHAHQSIQDFEAKQALAWEYQTHPDKLSDLLRETLDFAQTIQPSDYDDARMIAEVGSQQMDEVFCEIDALISLSAPGSAPKGLTSTGSSIFNRTWTLFGLPCVNVPGLMSDNGLPFGIQIIGPYMQDHNCLIIAHLIEQSIQRHLDMTG